MATYFHGNQEIQSQAASVEGLQTLVLMNPNFPQFNNMNSPNNFFFLNSAAMTNVPHPPPATTSTPPFVRTPMEHDVHGVLPRIQYNMYGPIEQISSANAQQGLSLSLSSHQQRALITGYPALSVENLRPSGSLLSSKYLKPAQGLLDEVVSVSGKNELSEKKQNRNTAKIAAVDGCYSGRVGQQLSATEKQEVENKKAKLSAMLDEVEQRYRQYDHQMQIVRASIKQAAGAGAENSYSALALGTVSKQFKSLKDAIACQIMMMNSTLGEEEKPEGSRLKLVDHQYRQQRPMQQMGMIHPNTWRPQRGLPERSVSVLRAWLFENFLHPYPKDSDKLMLAKRTGLTRSQVSNWFINARVRLWKPMVEEMYTEEIKLHERSNSASNDKSPENEETMNEQFNFAVTIATRASGIEANHNKLREADVLQPAPFSSTKSMDVKPREAPAEHISSNGHELSFFGGFGQFPMDDIGRFDANHFAPRISGNGVSLSLGLPNQELMSLSSSHQSFLQSQSVQLGRTLDHGEPSKFIASNSPSVAFESFNNIQDRKRFAAQLLPADFVA